MEEKKDDAVTVRKSKARLSGMDGRKNVEDNGFHRKREKLIIYSIVECYIY